MKGFEDGLRMMVSRDREESGTYLHISASVEPGFLLYAQIASGELRLRRFLQLVQERFTHLSGDHGPLHFCGLSSGKGVPHWRRLERLGGL